MDLEISLLVAAGVFAVAMIWRFRPSFAGGMSGKARKNEALKVAQARLDAAPTPEEKAAILCDMGDMVLAHGGRSSSTGFYLRAMRTSVASANVVDRVAEALARHPRTLETLLWRRLGAEDWRGPARPSAERAVEHLTRLYAGPLRSPVKARALQNAQALFRGAPSIVPAEPHAAPAAPSARPTPA